MAGAAIDNKKETAEGSKAKDRVAPTLLAIFSSGVLVILAGPLTGLKYQVVPVLLWSLAFCMTGMLAGFLFGIPRPVPHGMIRASDDQPAGSAQDSAKAKSASPEVFNEINSNLVEVSDWLTKIIVGVGLVEFKDLSQKAAETAAFIAPSFGLDQISGPPIVGSVMLFFIVLGFLAGYLLTRIYLAIIIKRADNDVKNQTVQLASGKEIEVATLAELQQKRIDDLQSTVGELVEPPAQKEGETPSGDGGRKADTSKTARVLWVDDKPDNNTLLVEQLRRDGVVVDEVLSTDQGMDALARNAYDAVISDMARYENGRHYRNAGINLTRQIAQTNPQLPVLIFCGKNSVDHFMDEALTAGARLITSSGTRLIARLNSILRSQAETPP